MAGCAPAGRARLTLRCSLSSQHRTEAAGGLLGVGSAGDGPDDTRALQAERDQLTEVRLVDAADGEDGDVGMARNGGDAGRAQHRLLRLDRRGKGGAGTEVIGALADVLPGGFQG